MARGERSEGVLAPKKADAKKGDLFKHSYSRHSLSMVKSGFVVGA